MFDRQKEKGTRTTDRAAAGSRPKSRMEVDEAPRSKGRFNLDRAAQEHINEGLEVWIPTESASSLRGLETKPIRPLMDVALPGYTPSSTPSNSQVSGSSSRLKELNEKLQLRNRDSPTRVELPPTWREQPVSNEVIASYKKNADGTYHRHNLMDWNAAQRARRDCFYDASWADYYTQPRLPEVAVHLIVGVGQPGTGADPDPLALADWSLEFLWSRNAADVGITRDACDGKNVHSDSNDGD